MATLVHQLGPSDIYNKIYITKYFFNSLLFSWQNQYFGILTEKFLKSFIRERLHEFSVASFVLWFHFLCMCLSLWLLVAQVQKGQNGQPMRLKYLKEFNEKADYPFSYVSSTSSDCFCKCCEKTFNGVQKGLFRQHIKTEKQKKNVEQKKKRSATQARLEEIVCHEPKKSK